MSNTNHLAVKQRIAQKIKAAKITTRLQNHVMAEPSDDDYENKQMTQSQVTAARILLAKVIPDLKQTEHTGDIGVQVTEVRRTIVDPRPTDS